MLAETRAILYVHIEAYSQILPRHLENHDNDDITERSYLYDDL